MCAWLGVAPVRGLFGGVRAEPLGLRTVPFVAGRGNWVDLSGDLYSGDGRVYQFVTRAQALRHLLVRAWLSPTLPRPNRAVMTEVVAPALSARCKMMARGSRPQPPYEQPRDEPWRHHAALDNAAGMSAFGPVVNIYGDAAPHLSVS